MFKQFLTPGQALQKSKEFCVYRERCHSEVKEKIYGLGLHQKEVDEILSTLIAENFLNEERFAIQYAGGKFRINQWGRVKIKYALRQKQVSDYCIKKALSSIAEKDYMQTIQKLSDQKRKTLKREKNVLIIKRKLLTFLLQRGFEGELVSNVIKNHTH